MEFDPDLASASKTELILILEAIGYSAKWTSPVKKMSANKIRQVIQSGRDYTRLANAIMNK